MLPSFVNTGGAVCQVSPSLHKAGFFFVLLFLGILPLSAQPVANPEHPLAIVEGDTIKVSDFDRSYIALLISTGANDTEANRSRHLNSLIDQYLLATEARRRGLDTDDDYEAFIERARQKAIGSRFYEMAALEALPPPTDAELREAFAWSKQQVAVRHLYYTDPSQAQAAYTRLREGSDFLQEAQVAYNLAIFDSSAGSLGLIGYFDVDDAFAEVAFGLEVGAYSKPFRSRYGYHIVRVEDKVVSPIVTESAYLASRDRIASQVRQRKRRLEGDAFVRSFMQERNVQVDTHGIAALAHAIQDLAHSVAPRLVSIDQTVEAQSIDPAARATLTPDTPLATYMLDGQAYTFTAGAYYFWLPDLPFEEAQDRTAASVGRALRNEVLARAGQQQAIDEDSLVQREIQERARDYLSRALLEALQQAPPPDHDDGLLEQAYERLGSALSPSESTEEEHSQQLREHLAPFLNEWLLLRDLRAAATVQIFDPLYN